MRITKVISRRHRVTAGLAGVALMAGSLAVFAGGAHASVTPGGVFEVDGSIDTPANGEAIPNTAPYDWSSLFDSNGNAIGANSSFTNLLARDFFADSSNPGDPQYIGGGSKDYLDTSGWGCTSKASAPKDEISNAYAAVFSATASGGGVAEGDKMLYLGLERPVVNGSANSGFWLFQNSVSCPITTTGVSKSTFNGTHQPGDLFILAGFTVGGTTPTLDAYAWPDLTNSVATSSVLCNASGVSTNTFCGMVNGANVVTPWGPNNTVGNGISPNGFYEVGIDLTSTFRALSQSVPCFSSFLADTRSSATTTSELHDFLSGGFPTCTPATDLTKTADVANGGSIAVGGTVHYSYAELNDGTSPLTKPTNTNFVVDDTCSPVSDVLGNGTTTANTTHNIGDFNNNGILDPGETWHFTCSYTTTTPGPVTNTAIGHAVDFANRDVTFCADPNHPPAPVAPATSVFCDVDETATWTVNVINPSTAVTFGTPAAPTQAYVGQTVTYPITETNNGNAPLSPPNAGFVSVTNCSSLTPVLGDGTTTADGSHNIGDLNNNGNLDPNEGFRYTCTASPATAGPNVVTATGHGIDSLNRDVTYCADPHNPPAPAAPATSVLCDATERAQYTTTFIQPGTTLAIDSSALVTLTYTETNVGTVRLSSPSVDGGLCTSVAPVLGNGTTTADSSHNIGDLNNDGYLDVGEHWKYTCTTTITGLLTAPGRSFLGTAHGTDPLSNDVTYCTSSATPPLSGSGQYCDSRERNSVTFTITQP